MIGKVPVNSVIIHVFEHCTQVAQSRNKGLHEVQSLLLKVWLLDRQHWNHLGDGDKIPGPWLYYRNPDLSAQTWPGQLSVLTPVEDAGAQLGQRSLSCVFSEVTKREGCGFSLIEVSPLLCLGYKNSSPRCERFRITCDGDRP